MYLTLWFKCRGGGEYERDKIKAQRHAKESLETKRQYVAENANVR